MENKKEIKNMEEKPMEVNQVEFYFQEENDSLNKTIEEIDELYNEVKTHYDSVKSASRTANGGRGILPFLEKQTANLVSLKNSKASLISNKITLKKIAMELALKQKKDSDESQINNDIVNAILDKLDEKDENTIFIDEYEEDENNDTSFSNEDDLLEARISELIKSGDIKDTSEVEESDDDEGILAVRVRNKKWSFVGINELGHIIKDFKVPNKKDYKMKLRKDDDGNSIAVDQNGKIYRVIKEK